MYQPLASIHPEAVIGENVKIGPFVTIDQNVQIGDGTEIAPNVTILSGSRIGKNCKIHAGAVIGGIPQDLKFAGEETLAIIGDNTTLRECVTVNRGTKSRNQTVIGSNCLVMAYCHVGHDSVVGNGVIMSNAVQIAGEVEIEDNAIISGGVLVHQFCKVGAYSMIQGGCRFSKDIPPYIILGRDPARYCGINIIGLRRRGFDAQTIENIANCYRVIYQSGLNYKEAIQKIETEMEPTTEINAIVKFVKESQRGIVTGSGKD